MKHEDYKVGWICVLTTELMAATYMLDERHDALDQPATDENDYTLGRIGPHNVVIAAPPTDKIDVTSAVRVAEQMRATFPSIRFGLMVGIGGGAPSHNHDIRLGDVVVSKPDGRSQGIIEYSLGKTSHDRSFETTRSFNGPPAILLRAINSLNVRYQIRGHQLEDTIIDILDKNPRLRKKFKRPEPGSDRLFGAEINHGSVCSTVCDDNPSNLIQRVERTEDDGNPAIHCGLIASSNYALKDARIRDKLAANMGVLGFRTAATGLMSSLPCLIILGIYNYSDSHPNHEWQGYAAMTAAAYTKDLLAIIRSEQVEPEKQLDIIHVDDQVQGSENFKLSARANSVSSFVEQPTGGMEISPSHILGGSSGQVIEESWDVTPSNTSLASEKWLQQLTEVTKRLSLESRQDGNESVNVVIIDLESASDNHKSIDSPHPNIVGNKSFSGSDQSAQRHVSDGASIQADLISRAAPGANLFIAHVQMVKGDTAGLDSQIAKAISYSISEWKVDIISMSFALKEGTAEVREAIQRALMHGVLVFAAASNGMIPARGLPARLPGVLCIHSADGHGNVSIFNPPPLHHDSNFSTLGEAIPVSASKQGKQTLFASGTSFATPIAAGIAATLLQFARQKQTDGLLSSAEVEHLHRPEGMASVLKAMGQSRDGMTFIQPWRLWSADKSSEESIKEIQSALAESLGSQQAVEDDLFETASVTGFSVAGHSDLSGSTAIGDGPTSIEEEIALLLLEDPVMKPLFNPSVARAGLASFRSHFESLLRRHASRLRREAETKLEKGVTILLQNRAKIISNFVTNMISLANEEKKAKLTQLMETEPARTEILNRYIADNTNVTPSARAPTFPIEASDDMDEDDVDDHDAEAEEADESAMDNAEAVKRFIRSTKPFQRLREDISLFAFPDTSQLICTTVDNLGLFHQDSDVMTINCHAIWEVLACCKAEVEDLHNIAQTVTFTGNSKNAQAASCAEYLRQTWPETGDTMMRAFRQAVTVTNCEVQFSKKHRLKLQLEPAIDKLEQPESASVEITGSRSDVLESFEQLSWLAATFRKPQGGGMTSSYANLTQVPEPLMPTKASPLLELTLLSPRPVPFKAGTEGSCWVPLLRESILVGGFPIAPRDQGLGLEVPVPLMMYLAGVHYPIEYDDQGIVFRSHIRPDPEALSMLIPTKKLEGAVQWHFVENKTAQGLPEDDKRSTFIDNMVNSDVWYQSKDLDFLVTSRAFLGCWPSAKVLIGTEEFHSRTILDSGLHNAGLELHILTAGNVNVGGNISVGIAKILRVGMTCGIAFGYELRRAQQAVIEADQVGLPLVFRNAAQQPVLLYDSEAQSAWLVPELNVALDMTHHFLASLNLAPSIRAKLRYATATGDGGAAAADALDACRNKILWEDDTRKIRFHHVIKIILSLLGERKPAAKRGQLSSFDPTKPFRSPRGWEYVQLRSLDSNVHRQKKMDRDHDKDRSWWEITKDPTVVTLVGRGFGQVIQPNSAQTSACPTWRAVPNGHGLLMASMPCFQKVTENDQYTKLKHSKLRWHQPEDSTLFEPCQPGRACVRIQELRKPGHFGRAKDIRAPARHNLMATGAVVFGNFPRNPRQPVCPGPPPAVARTGNPVGLSLLAILVGMLLAALMSILKVNMAVTGQEHERDRLLNLDQGS